MVCSDNDMSGCVISSQPEVCVLNTDVGVAVSVSLCSFHVGRCHDDPLFFISEEVCDPAISGKLEWVKFRAQMSSKSPVRQTCGLDTCYQWETCTGEETLLVLENLEIIFDISRTGSSKTPTGVKAHISTSLSKIWIIVKYLVLVHPRGLERFIGKDWILISLRSIFLSEMVDKTVWMWSVEVHTPHCCFVYIISIWFFHILTLCQTFCFFSASMKCQCKSARNCEQDEKLMFCIKLTRSPRTRSLNLCSMAALKCANYDFEILSEGVCESRWSVLYLQLLLMKQVEKCPVDTC